MIFFSPSSHCARKTVLRPSQQLQNVLHTLLHSQGRQTPAVLKKYSHTLQRLTPPCSSSAALHRLSHFHRLSLFLPSPLKVTASSSSIPRTEGGEERTRPLSLPFPSRFQSSSSPRLATLPSPPPIPENHQRPQGRTGRGKRAFLPPLSGNFPSWVRGMEGAFPPPLWQQSLSLSNVPFFALAFGGRVESPPPPLWFPPLSQSCELTLRPCAPPPPPSERKESEKGRFEEGGKRKGGLV